MTIDETQWGADIKGAPFWLPSTRLATQFHECLHWLVRFNLLGAPSGAGCTGGGRGGGGRGRPASGDSRGPLSGNKRALASPFIISILLQIQVVAVARATIDVAVAGCGRL